MITIIDYDMGNIGSIVNIMHSVGCDDVTVTNDQRMLSSTNGIILPGVGAFDEGVKKLRQYGLYDAIIDRVKSSDVPILGICLGMQLLGESSEEGTESGLGLIPFHCRKFEVQDGFKVPHMGWEYVTVKDKNTLLTESLPDVQRYYFVHSYYAECDKEENVMMECEYGIKFAAAVHSDRIYGVQFHPEKSHHFGKRIFKNFIGEAQ